MKTSRLTGYEVHTPIQQPCGLCPKKVEDLGNHHSRNLIAEPFSGEQQSNGITLFYRKGASAAEYSTESIGYEGGKVRVKGIELELEKRLTRCVTSRTKSPFPPKNESAPKVEKKPYTYPPLPPPPPSLISKTTSSNNPHTLQPTLPTPTVPTPTSTSPHQTHSQKPPSSTLTSQQLNDLTMGSCISTSRPRPKPMCYYRDLGGYNLAQFEDAQRYGDPTPRIPGSGWDRPTRGGGGGGGGGGAAASGGGYDRED